MDDRRPRILIVDDVPHNISVFNEILKRHYSVTAATSGEKALEIASTDPRPDLVLLDIMMPGMDGYEVYRRLQSNEPTRRIPVIFLTACRNDSDYPSDLDLRDAVFLRKPVWPRELLKAMERSLRMQG
jgi:putative two-component system response regulator